MCRVQEPRPYLKGQGHTIILNVHIIAIRVNRYMYTHLCQDYNYHASNDFKITKHKCLQHQGDVSRPKS
jgi:hypothetical protein